MPSDAARPRLLVLWDIDHTLVETRGVGFAIYQRAFPVATGQPLKQLAQVSGRTELDIMRESLRINGVKPTSEAVNKLVATLIRGYEDARQELAATGRALPGAHDTLAALADNPAYFQTVLTGNLREVARIKLEVFSLDQFLELGAGAYGDDHQERAQLVSIAQRRAAQCVGARFDSHNTVLVGDTLNDVIAGLQAGVKVIAVATGRTGAAELRRAGATQVVESLQQVEMMIAR